MGAALSSVPPPPDPRIARGRRPGLASCGLKPHRDANLTVVLDWMRERKVSDRDWVAWTGLCLSRIDQVMTGHAPFPMEWLDVLPARDGDELEFRLRDARAARRRRRSA